MNIRKSFLTLAVIGMVGGWTGSAEAQFVCDTTIHPVSISDDIGDWAGAGTFDDCFHPIDPDNVTVTWLDAQLNFIAPTESGERQLRNVDLSYVLPGRISEQRRAEVSTTHRKYGATLTGTMNLTPLHIESLSPDGRFTIHNMVENSHNGTFESAGGSWLGDRSFKLFNHHSETTTTFPDGAVDEFERVNIWTKIREPGIRNIAVLQQRRDFGVLTEPLAGGGSRVTTLEYIFALIEYEETGWDHYELYRERVEEYDVNGVLVSESDTFNDESGNPAVLAFYEENPTKEYLDEICPEQARIQRYLDREEDPVAMGFGGWCLGRVMSDDLFAELGQETEFVGSSTREIPEDPLTMNDEHFKGWVLHKP